MISPYRMLWGLYALPGVVAFVVWYGSLYFPFTAQPPAASGIQLRVMTFNVATPTPSDTEFQQRLDIIEAIDADIVGLQESIELPSDVIPYPYTYTESSMTLWSRYPIDTNSIKFTGSPGIPVALRVEVLVGNTPISVYVFHPKRPVLSVRPLLYDPSLRTQHVRQVITDIQNEQNPVIVLCDCNMGYRTDDYQILAGELVDSWRQRGFGLGLTAPVGQNDSPVLLLRSDIIWHTNDITTMTIEVYNDSGGSDHLPIFAELALN